MDFSKDTVHEDIRQAVRDLCAKFPDEYWMEHDQSHEFPWEFYNAIAEARLARDRPSPRSTAAAGSASPRPPSWSRRSPPPAAGMNGVQRRAHRHLRLRTDHQARQRGPEAAFPAPPWPAATCTSPSPSPSPTPAPTPPNITTFAAQGRRRLPGLRQEGVDHQGPGGRAADPAAARTTPRDAGGQEDRRHDAVLRDRWTATRSPCGRSPRWAATRSTPTSCSSTTCSSPTRTSSARSGKGFKTILAGLNAERVISAERRHRHRPGAPCAGPPTTPSERVVFGRPDRQEPGHRSSRWPRP